MNKDVLQITLSDFHSGSNYALFPARQWQGLNGMTHNPTSRQMRIRSHFETMAENLRKLRKGKRVQLVHNGDAIDGDHHNSQDVCSQNEKEQADIHIELMNEFQKRIDWQRGDEIYYTEGTQTHVTDWEHYIAEQMNAIPDASGERVHSVLRLNTNGVLTMYFHTGPRRGQGASEGNPVRSWLKNIYYDALKDGRNVPDIVYTGHVHDPTFATFEHRDRMNFRLMYGIILPSWQMKTRYAREKAALSINKIGGVSLEIKADGTRGLPVFYVMETE